MTPAAAGSPAPRPAGGAAARQHAILERLSGQGRLEVSDLAEVFDVTTETVRRDLIALEDAGLARRVHGGVVGVLSGARPSAVPSLLERGRLMTAQKRDIAERALTLLPAEGLVILDAGTTVGEVARSVPPGSLASFVVVALPTALELAGRGVDDVHILGGELNRTTLAAGGDWALRALADLTADVALLGASGVNAGRGATTSSHADAILKRAIISSARRCYLLADSSKVGLSYMSRFAGVEEFDGIVIDRDADEREIEALRAHDVDVILV